VTTYIFQRISTGREFAYMDTPDAGRIQYADIVDHEDFEWKDWELVDTEDDGEDYQ
jgi:hypothetical protein